MGGGQNHYFAESKSVVLSLVPIIDRHVGVSTTGCPGDGPMRLGVRAVLVLTAFPFAFAHRNARIHDSPTESWFSNPGS
jgi:hypothetical protein